MGFLLLRVRYFLRLSLSSMKICNFCPLTLWQT